MVEDEADIGMDEKKISKRVVKLQILICGLIFAIFSFTYLYAFQRDLLGAVHYTLSHGLTHYVALPSALTITAILLLLRWGVNTLLGLKSIIRALAYFPSFLTLAALTDVSRTILTASYQSEWLWQLPVGILCFAIIAFILRRFLRNFLNEYIHPLALLVSNLLIMISFCVLTVSIGNTNRDLHFELKAERLIREGNFSAAANVGATVGHATRTLTVLRAYALARSGSLGDQLFAYPQSYRSKGLFFADDSTKTLRMTNDSIYALLGVRPQMGVTPDTAFLASVCRKGIGRHIALEYYLSGLLLEKQLPRFASEVRQYYFSDETLPQYFQQALLMYHSQYPTDTIPPIATSIREEYDRYLQLKRDTHNDINQKVRMKEAEGHTYWWYYDFQ